MLIGPNPAVDGAAAPARAASFLARLRAASSACASVLVGLGVAVLVGWTLNVQWLMTVVPGLGSMKPNTALGFLLAGVALLLAQSSTARPRLYAQIAAWLVTLLGVVTLLEYQLAWDTGIDQLLFVDPDPVLFPGRMPPGSALLFVLLGSGLLWLDRPIGSAAVRPSECLALVIGALSLFVLLGYLYGVERLYAFPPFSSMAVHSAAGFALSSAALLLARPETGIVMPRLTSADSAGILSRQLLPTAIVAPVVLGWLRLWGQRAGWYGTEAGVAIFAASSVVGLSAMTWLIAGALERAERTRLRNNESKRTGFGVARMMAWEADLATGSLHASDNAHELLGLLPSNPFDRLEHGLAIIHVDDRASIEEALEQTAHLGATTDRRFRIVRQDTQAIAWFEWRSVARLGTEGDNVVGGVLLDIDDAVQREEALRVSEARYRAQFESAPEAIMTYDMDHNVCVEANENAERLFGYGRRTLLHSSRPVLSPLQQPDGRNSREAADAYFARALTGERLTFEWTYQHADGQLIPCEVRLVRQPGEGNLCRVSVVDISERKRTELARAQLEEALRATENQLRQAQKMEAIGRLAGGVAHDFNNLLFVILGYGSMLIDGLREGDPMRATLQQIVQASERAARLTAQLLAFSRQQVLSARVMNLNRTIEELADMLRRLIGEDIALAMKLDATRDVCVDPSQLEQVVMNLVVNARDAMPAGGELVIATADVDLDEAHAQQHLELGPGAYVMLSVTDTGCGMDAATRERIFEPFFTTKSFGKGTGLGLSTVFGITKQSGGSVGVQSEPGKGTTFQIYLPRGDTRSEAPKATVVSAESLRGTENVLLVEDDESVRGLARVILSRHGYHVLEASTPGDALLICEQFASAIDLLLSDVVMPRMSGRELAERLAPLRPNMKVLFMSGYTDDAIVRHGVLSATTAFVQKPLMPAELLGKIRQLLGPRAA